MKKLKTKIIDLRKFSFYISYFHDGVIESITHIEDEIIFEMESAAIFVCDNRYHLPLSERNTIYGKLHAKEISCLKMNEKIVSSLKMKYDYVDIIRFEITNGHIFFSGSWEKNGVMSLPKEDRTFWCEVDAGKIYWENTANITDPNLLGKYMGLEGPPSYGYPQWYIDKYGPQEDEE